MNTELKIAGKEDINELKALWLSCFDDSPEAADLFFERNKNTYHAYAATENGKIVSAIKTHTTLTPRLKTAKLSPHCT